MYPEVPRIGQPLEQLSEGSRGRCPGSGAARLARPSRCPHLSSRAPPGSQGRARRRRARCSSAATASPAGTEKPQNQGSRALIIQQTCRGSFLAVSKPIYAEIAVDVPRNSGACDGIRNAILFGEGLVKKVCRFEEVRIERNYFGQSDSPSRGGRFRYTVFCLVDLCRD